jgi:DNA-binding beta-propeller fold protein YncE
MYSRNTSTGALAALGTPTIATGTNPYSITISADGTSVYAANGGPSTVSMYSRNTGTGALAALGTPTIATGTNPYSVTISADGTSVYVANYTSSTISMYSRNTSTGALATSTLPTITDSIVYESGSFSTGAYTESLTSLTANTSYIARAYATNSAGTAYGSAIQFMTLIGTTTGVNVWNGSSWTYKPLNVWNGSSWAAKPIEVWNGTSWVVKG